MESNFESLKKELNKLAAWGDMLYYAMADGARKLPGDFKKELESRNLILPSFETEYQTWYSEALRVVKQIIPDRIDDFVNLYKNEKRKELDFTNYCIADYLLGITVRRYGEVIVERSAAIPKMQIQVAILKSAAKRFDSSLFDIREILQADLFDTELASSRELAKNGFFRAGGAVAGVVLEKHLGHVCACHGLKIKKGHPSISDYYQLLKEGSVIDAPKWRFIQHLCDIRNLCVHGKDREPTKDDIIELVEGVEKVIKTVS